ncbi:membrane protein [Acrocarpospora phusangensis]|uniref:Membrane protein n=1 Tax=Acrocarpospora phusangensis TaxID=1070424 RepID=A0A919QFD7_9ACTN|nr:DUF2752 domain-containing protein [Acrocarpospora phusangensis]GIH26370.1 membrane protein [Acrocarpospora phusangensis]
MKTVTRRRLAPAAVAAVTLAATGYVAAVDPNAPGHYPVCPFLAVSGFYCPGCGTLRAVHALAHGDPLAALDLNPLFTLTAPVLVYLWARWALAAWTGRRMSTVLARPVFAWGFVAAALLFWVARNLPAGRILAP